MDAFSDEVDITNATLYVPEESLDTYQTTLPWSNFGKIATCKVTVSSNAGDANGDGNVTLDDVTPLLSYLLTGNASEVNLSNADVNGDGVISIGDITALIKKLQDVNQ